MITFYDIAAKDPIKTWSPNPWKTRFVLNYKKLPYQVVAHEYCDMESEYIKLGIPPNPTMNWLDGRPLYTSPSIIDNSNNTPVTDSYAIAEYLDKTYPDTPKAFPPGTEALQAAFYTQYNELITPAYLLLIPKTPSLLNPRSQEYVYRTRKQILGMSLEDLEPKGVEKVKAWKTVEKVFDTLDGWLSKSQGQSSTSICHIEPTSMITFYDLAKKDPKLTWSPNPWKTRFSLNFKKLPYTTINLEYPDIEGEFVKVGISASLTWPDGRPLYTSPSIFDSSTNTGVSESYQIAQYLDKAYPDTPKLFPPGTEALQAAFYAQFNTLIAPYFTFFIPRVPAILNPGSAEYFTRTRGEKFGKPFADIDPKGQARVEVWKKVEAVYDTLNGWLSKSSGPYFMGDTVTFADFVVASTIYAMEVVFGENSQEWKDLMTWNNGRWAKFRKSVEQYASMG